MYLITVGDSINGNTRKKLNLSSSDYLRYAGIANAIPCVWRDLLNKNTDNLEVKNNPNDGNAGRSRD